MIKINPIELTGNWEKGFALDLHTVSSELLGYDEFGHEVFDTKRSEMGELLYRLKYRSDTSTIDEILEAVVWFLKEKWKINNLIDCIVPIPPSNVKRTYQPVIELAKGIGSILQTPVYLDVVTKTKETPELKNVYEKDQRAKLLKGAFKANIALTRGKRVLLVDDLFRSGATCSEITQILQEQGKVKAVYLLALTKTRTKT